jgi:hypothetical protein
VDFRHEMTPHRKGKGGEGTGAELKGFNLQPSFPRKREPREYGDTWPWVPAFAGMTRWGRKRRS